MAFSGGFSDYFGYAADVLLSDGGFFPGQTAICIPEQEFSGAVSAGIPGSGQEDLRKPLTKSVFPERLNLYEQQSRKVVLQSRI